MTVTERGSVGLGMVPLGACLTRRRAVLVPPALAAGPLLAACTARGQGAQNPAAQPAKTPVTIDLTSAWPDTVYVEAIQAQVTRFTKQFPHISVNLQPATSTKDWTDKRKVEAAAGEAVDVSIHYDMFLWDLAAPGLLVDLGPYIKQQTKTVQADDIWPGVLESGKYKGKQFALFWVGPNVLVTVYNIDLFQAAGESTPDQLYAKGQWTWPNVREIARRMTNTRNPDRKVFGTTSFILGNVAWRSVPLWQFGTDLFNADHTRLTLNSPQGVECVEHFSNLVCRDGTAPLRTQDDYEYQPDTGAVVQGRVAIPFENHTALVNSRYDMWPKDIAPLPSYRQSASMLSTAHISLMQLGKHKEAGWEYVQFAASPPEQQQMQKQKGFAQVSAHRRLFDSWMAQMEATTKAKNLRYVKDALQAAKSVQLTTNQADLNAIWNKYLAGGRLGSSTGLLGTCQGGSAKDVCDTITREANQLLSQG